jgi:hypothetical protein
VVASLNAPVQDRIGPISPGRCTTWSADNSPEMDMATLLSIRPGTPVLPQGSPDGVASDVRDTWR